MFEKENPAHPVKIAETARQPVRHVGGFEKLAAWGLI